MQPTSERYTVLKSTSVSFATAQLPHLRNSPMFAPLRMKMRTVREPNTTSLILDGDGSMKLLQELVATGRPVFVAAEAAGVPVTVAAEVAGLEVLPVSRYVGLLLPPLSLLVPGWLCVMLCGWRRSLEVLPAILAAGVTLAATQFLVATTIGPWATGVLSGLAAMAALVVLVRFWKPGRVWNFGGAPVAASPPSPVRPTARQALRAWSPWLLTSALVLAWGTGLPRTLRLPAVLASPGTAMFLAGCISVPLLPGLGLRKAAACFGRTLWTMRWTIVTVCTVLAMAYVMNAAGMSGALGLALAATGPLFPLFSALIGWVGVLLTGSDTSSNALFGSLQKVTATQLGLNPVLICAANSTGGVMGKMIDAQSIVVAAAVKTKKTGGRSTTAWCASSATHASMRQNDVHVARKAERETDRGRAKREWGDAVLSESSPARERHGPRRRRYGSRCSRLRQVMPAPDATAHRDARPCRERGPEGPVAIARGLTGTGPPGGPCLH